jgi:hypothetical protein
MILFIYGLYSYTVSISNDIVLNGQMIRKDMEGSGSNLRHHPSSYLEGLEENCKLLQ